MNESDSTNVELEISQLNQKISDYEQMMVELNHRIDIQNSLNEMLNISLMPISLEDQMNKILMLVLNIEWLALDKKGCVFLTDDSGKALDMVAFHNLGEPLLKLCTHIDFGQCLCGRAAVSQNLIFKNCVDHEHDIVPEGMTEHGHYNMPIISEGKTLGVLNLYVKHGHQPSTIEEEFLQSTSKTMAGIIERKKIEERLHQLSYEDELTKIPNRRQFMLSLNEVINNSKQLEKAFAVLFIDLDKFKVINDDFGHEYGDEILVQAASRMQEVLRDTDIIARLGGDEFVVLLEQISSPVMALKVANKLIESISKPYAIKEEKLSIGASIGVSLYPTHGEKGELLLKYADNALYDAKETRGRSVLYVTE